MSRRDDENKTKDGKHVKKMKGLVSKNPHQGPSLTFKLPKQMFSSVYSLLNLFHRLPLFWHVTSSLSTKELISNHDSN